MPQDDPIIRPLNPVSDRAAIEAFFREIEDHIRMERGEGPGPEVVEEFLTEAPPGCDPAKSWRLGLFAGPRILALAEMARGYPGPTDAYLGFMAVAAQARGGGTGQRLLRHLEEVARGAGARMLYLAVLEANPRGRAFWEREGFTLALASGEVTLGQKTQIAHRLGKALQGGSSSI